MEDEQDGIREVSNIVLYYFRSGMDAGIAPLPSSGNEKLAQW